MPGGLPTGGDPNYYDPHPFSLVGGGFSDLNTRDEVTVRPILEEDVKNRQATKGNSDLVFSGLNASLGLPGAVIKAALQMITGIPLQIVSGGLNAVLGAFRGIPASAIVDEDSENLLFNPQFNVDLNGWTSTVTGITPHYVVDTSEGQTVAGSAKVVAGGGVTKTLRSTRIPVSKDNTVKVSASYKMTGGTGTANPIRVHLRFYDAVGILLGFNTIGAVSGTGTIGWTEITAASLVPTDIHPTCKSIEVELSVSSTMTAGTVWWDDIEVLKGGLIPQSLIGGLADALLSLVDGTAFQGLLDTLAGVGEGLGDFLNIGNRLNFLNPDGTFDASQLMNLANIPAGIAQAAVTGLTGTIATVTGLANGWIAGFFNAVTGNNFADADVSVAQAKAQAAALAEQQMQMAIALQALQNQQDGGTFQGLASYDDFERVDATGIGTDWTVTHTASTASNGQYTLTDGHSAKWPGGKNGNQTMRALRTKTEDRHTQTLYQKVSFVVGTYIGQGQVFGVNSSNIVLRCRCNDADTQYVFVRIRPDGIARFGYCNGGSEIMVGSDFDVPTPSPGTTYTLFAGTSGGVRVFQLMVGSTNIYGTWNDSGNLSAAVDGTNNGWGWGAFAADGGATIQARPADAAFISISDNVPATVYGTNFRANRLLTTNVDLGSRGPGVYQISNSFFNNVDFISNDLSWDSTTQTLTINTTGTYQVRIMYYGTAGLNSIQWTPVLYRDTGSGLSVWRRGAGTWGGGNPSTHHTVASGFIVPITAGWKLKPGIDLSAFSGQCLFQGDASGIVCEFTVTRVA